MGAFSMHMCFRYSTERIIACIIAYVIRDVYTKCRVQCNGTCIRDLVVVVVVMVV